MTPSTVDTLRAEGLDPATVAEIVERALAEDLGPDRLDVTSVATIPAEQTDVGDLVARADGVVAGLPARSNTASTLPTPSQVSRLSRECNLATVMTTPRICVNASWQRLNSAFGGSSS